MAKEKWQVQDRNWKDSKSELEVEHVEFMHSHLVG